MLSNIIRLTLLLMLICQQNAQYRGQAYYGMRNMDNVENPQKPESPQNLENPENPESLGEPQVLENPEKPGNDNEDDIAPEDIARYKVNKMKYQWNNWRPHFGYRPAHYAINHRQEKFSIPVDSDDLNSFLVSLRYKKRVFCSGIVINNRTVLTVKSCLFNKTLTAISVHFTDGTVQSASKSTDSKGYTMETGAHFLSFLHLSKTLGKRFLIPPRFCLKTVGPRSTVEQWSWGRNHLEPIKTIAPQVPNGQCKKLNYDAKEAVLTGAVNCVENTQLTKKCQKTYGLPYVWKGAFCGMNILGHNCPNASIGDVYVRLLKEKRFISRALRMAVASDLDNLLL